MALTGNSTRQRESQSVYPQTLYKLSLVSVRLVVHGFCPHLHVCRSLSIHSINYLAVYCFTTILHNALTHSPQFSHNSINCGYKVGVPRHPIGTAFVRCQFFTAFQTGILVIWLFVPSLGHPFNTDQPNCPLRLYCPLLAYPARCLPLFPPAVCPCWAVYRCGWRLSIAAAVDGVLVRLI